MESDEEFAAFGRAIQSDPIGVLMAKWRRDVFIRKLERLPDVDEVIASGSLARDTYIGPVHDVDLIVVFKSEPHPDYGIKGKSALAAESAQASITHLEGRLLEQLHPWQGTAGGLLKETEQHSHVVRCRGDWAGPLREIMPGAPPVDVMPAVREGSHLLIPERGTGWIDTDPEELIRQVAQRQREWKYFTQVTGMVKEWARINHLKIRNLAIDVMVLQYCPRPRLFETLSCGDAVAGFLQAAFDDNFTSLKDPTGRCGKLKLGINFGKLHKELGEASRLASLAMEVENLRKHHLVVLSPNEVVLSPNEIWRELFGRKFPRAKKRFWRAQETEPWVAMPGPEPVATAGSRAWGGPRESGGPRPWGGPGETGGPVNPRFSGPGGGPTGPDHDPDGPRFWPRGPGRGPTRPSGRPFGQRHSPEPAEAGASLWSGIFGPAAPRSVPLTYG